MSSETYLGNGEDDWPLLMRRAIGGTLLAFSGLSIGLMVFGAGHEANQTSYTPDQTALVGELNTADTADGSSTDSTGLGIMCVAAVGGTVLLLPRRKSQMTQEQTERSAMPESLPLDLSYLVSRQVAHLDFPTPDYLQNYDMD